MEFNEAIKSIKSKIVQPHMSCDDKVFCIDLLSDIARMVNELNKEIKEADNDTLS